MDICGTCPADMSLPLCVVGARSGARSAVKIAEQSWLMNAEHSSGREHCYPTACVLGREREGTFSSSLSSEVQPLLSPALQVLNMTENKINSDR